MQSGQPNISTASTSRLHRSASGTSKPQSTSPPTQQPASATRPTRHLCSLNQPTSLFHQWNIQAVVDIYTNPAASQCNPANRTSLQPQPADFIVPPVEHPSRSRHLHQTSSQPVQSGQPNISAASTSRLHRSTSGTSNSGTSSGTSVVDIYTTPAASQCNPANRTSVQPQPAELIFPPVEPFNSSRPSVPKGHTKCPKGHPECPPRS